MKKGSLAVQAVLVLAVVALLTWSAAAANISKPRKTSKAKSVVENSGTKKKKIKDYVELMRFTYEDAIETNEVEVFIDAAEEEPQRL